jgi:protein SCO1/2
MANLRAGLADTEVQFVSFSVDPATDTPDVLRAYRTRMDANGEGWTFLTGEHEAVRQAIEGQMRVMMGERAGGDIPHSMHFILVDRAGHIRGFYNSSDREELARLAADARRLDDG